MESGCEHFIECIIYRKLPRTYGHSGLRVLKILEARQEFPKENGKLYPFIKEEKKKHIVHKSSFIDEKV